MKAIVVLIQGIESELRSENGQTDLNLVRRTTDKR